MSTPAPEKRFHRINIEISDVCNLKCSFCPEAARPQDSPRVFMQPGLFRKIAAQASALAGEVCFHLMGEPLAHPGFPELVEECQGLGVPILLVTNGTLLREKTAEILLRSAIRQVNFSLHSFPDNFPERDPSTYLERIFAFTEAAFERRPDLYINFRLWNLQAPRGAGARNREILQRIEERFGTRANPNADVRIHKSLRLKNRLYLHQDTEFVWPSLDAPVVGERGTCQALTSHFGILADGTVVPCCLDKDGAIPLGNAGERPLLEILEGARARKILQGFREGRLTEELCRRCRYIERFR
ncbi:MAG: radical SAM protein [Oligoflexia bacterium]|nr:radical SAM protein [Oligoflexia bacterium]